MPINLGLQDDFPVTEKIPTPAMTTSNVGSKKAPLVRECSIKGPVSMGLVEKKVRGSPADSGWIANSRTPTGAFPAMMVSRPGL